MVPKNLVPTQGDWWKWLKSKETKLIAIPLNINIRLSLILRENKKKVKQYEKRYSYIVKCAMDLIYSSGNDWLYDHE